MKEKIKLPFFVKKPILALGSHTKNTICFAKDNTAFISRIHTDLDSWQDFLEFQKDIKFFLKKKPKILACDLHPLYRSTKMAEELSGRDYILKKIQHHHAHIASAMVENNLDNQKVIGVAFDGTGLGLDGNLWGAEFLLADYSEFKRIAHLRYIALPGAEMAIKEPWRIAFSWLYSIYKDDFFKLSIELNYRINYNKLQSIKKILISKFNCPFSSSMGRLFDAVAVLVLNKFVSSYEGQLPKKLEDLARRFRSPFNLDLRDYYFIIKKENQTFIIEPSFLFKGIIKDIKSKRNPAEIAFKFHLAVAILVKDLCLIIRRDTALNKIVLSGGVFQNILLRTLVLDLLNKDGFVVFYHKDTACFDAGISLGQVAVANFL